MAIQTHCGNCGKGYQLDDRFAGKKAKCKACASVMQIPAAAPAEGVIASASAPSASVTRARSGSAARTSPASLTSANRASAARAAGRAMPPPMPPPQPEYAEPEVPSFNDLAQLEATGTPDKFSHLPPPAVIAAKDPWFAVKKGTTIADADPKVAKAYAKKMSRRTVMAGGGGVLGVSGFGGIYYFLRILNAGARVYNNTHRSDSTDDDSPPAQTSSSSRSRPTPSSDDGDAQSSIDKRNAAVENLRNRNRP